MPRPPEPTPPVGTPVSRVRHRIPFYETDAMGIVHHANYVRWLELARVAYLDEHDRPYRAYMAEGLHFATTRIEVDYRRPLRFDDVIDVAVWLAELRGASLRMAYAIRCDGVLAASASSEHALVDGSGRPQRLRGRFAAPGAGGA